MKCIACGYILQTQNLDFDVNKPEKVAKRIYKKEFKIQRVSVQEKIEIFKDIVNQKENEIIDLYNVSQIIQRQFNEEKQQIFKQLDQFTNENYVQMMYLINQKWKQFIQQQNIKVEKVLPFNFLSPQYYTAYAKRAACYFSWITFINLGVPVPLLLFVEKQNFVSLTQMIFLCSLEKFDMITYLQKSIINIKSYIQYHPIFKQLTFKNYEQIVSNSKKYLILPDMFCINNTFSTKYIHLPNIIVINILLTLAITFEQEQINFKPVQQQESIQYEGNYKLQQIYEDNYTTPVEERYEEDEKMINHHFFQTINEYNQLIKSTDKVNYINVQENIETYQIKNKYIHDHVLQIPSFTYLYQIVCYLYSIQPLPHILKKVDILYHYWFLDQFKMQQQERNQ